MTCKLRWLNSNGKLNWTHSQASFLPFWEAEPKTASSNIDWPRFLSWLYILTVLLNCVCVCVCVCHASKGVASWAHTTHSGAKVTMTRKNYCKFLRDKEREKFLNNIEDIWGIRVSKMQLWQSFGIIYIYMCILYRYTYMYLCISYILIIEYYNI